MIEPSKYVRKPFEIDAVKVTDENIKEVAEWCNGDIRSAVMNTGEAEQPYIKVRVHNPIGERQTKAFVGDWVLYANNGFKVYMNKAFNRAFNKVENPSQQILDFTENTGEVVQAAALEAIANSDNPTEEVPQP